MGEYRKPHLTYDEQLARMIQRGLACTDRAAAIDLLRAVGYYRLSAYVYPLRESAPVDPDSPGGPVQHRLDTVRHGSKFDHVEALWRWDRKLRLLCLDAIETVEIGVRTRLAYTLGRRDPFGHVHRESLDPAACAQPAQRAGQTSGTTAFQEWLSKYDGLKHKARDEDYVVHHHRKYGGELPIWIAVEFLDFGASARLFRLLDRRDQNAIAKDLGMSGGPLLANWLRDLNYLRNLCAHHARLWNRRPTYKPAKFQPAQVGAELRHAAQLEPRLKIYVHLAVLAYLVRSIDRRQNWPLALRTHLRKFPDIPDLSPEADMGFPVGWVELPLWTMKEPT